VCIARGARVRASARIGCPCERAVDFTRQREPFLRRRVEPAGELRIVRQIRACRLRGLVEYRGAMFARFLRVRHARLDEASERTEAGVQRVAEAVDVVSHRRGPRGLRIDLALRVDLRPGDERIGPQGRDDDRQIDELAPRKEKVHCVPNVVDPPRDVRGTLENDLGTKSRRRVRLTG